MGMGGEVRTGAPQDSRLVSVTPPLAHYDLKFSPPHVHVWFLLDLGNCGENSNGLKTQVASHTSVTFAAPTGYVTRRAEGVLLHSALVMLTE